MGAGKSTVGKKLASRINYKFIDTDHYIAEKEGMSIPDIFRYKGEAHFRKAEHEVLVNLAEYEDNLVISTGGGAPCFMNNMDFMNSSGITVYLKMDPEELFHRLSGTKKKNRPLIQDKSPEELHIYIIEKLAEREPFYCRSNIIVPGKKLKTKDIESKILKFREEFKDSF
jgi:shikimate kinase